jgi:hypothetical protein
MHGRRKPKFGGLWWEIPSRTRRASIQIENNKKVNLIIDSRAKQGDKLKVCWPAGNPKPEWGTENITKFSNGDEKVEICPTNESTSVRYNRRQSNRPSPTSSQNCSELIRKMTAIAKGF